MATQPSECDLRPSEEDPLLDLAGAEALIEQLRAQAELEHDAEGIHALVVDCAAGMAGLLAG